jgi:cytochrome b subunit of formate dehydrogenase
LHVSNVAATCSKCHQFLEQRLAASVHGRAGGAGSAAERPAVGGKIKRNPSCTDCHQGHHLLRSDVPEFRLQVTNDCGNCHADLSSRYALSTHGELTRQGYEAAANCADCHGAHDIVPVGDANSPLAAGENRLRTCQKCHPHAGSNFTDFDPHANFKDAARYPKLHAVYTGIKYAANVAFACFLLHASLWFVRALVHRLRHGGHATLIADQYALPRYGPTHRASYAALIVAFLGLTSTGLALKHSSQDWGRSLALIFGGFRAASDWHHIFAVLAIVTVVINVARTLRRIGKLRPARTWTAIVLGPDSLVPQVRDLRDLGQMLLWFIGAGPKPGFERWAYWEKLDYWAGCLAGGLIGISGLMLWYPSLFCVLFPGGVLNVAKVIHSEFAIYLTSFLFLIHYFHAHFRPEKFPMDLSLLTGMVSEAHLRKYRPDYVARLEREGKLNGLRQIAPSRSNLGLNVVGGLLVFTLGFCLLAITLLASLSD